MIKKIKIADAQTDLPSLVKSVTEDNKIYAIENQEDSVILISQKTMKVYKKPSNYYLFPI